MIELPEPHVRETIVGRADVEAQLRASIAAAVISNGWLICGPKGAGKATLAYRMARAILNPAALAPGETLDMPADARTFRLVGGKAHPDLFVAERSFDEKNDRYETEVSVETIRDLGSFLSKTAAGGWRVAIVDTADDLNRNATNALLKSLEEPPPRTALLLLAERPGQLLATVRSRCRKIRLRPLADELVVGLLRDAGLSAADAPAVSAMAQGRPGYALSLASDEGVEAIALAERFLELVLAGKNAGSLSPSLTTKAAAGKWGIFLNVLLEKIARAAGRAGRGEAAEGPLIAAGAPALIEAHEQLAALSGRGEALNLDRGQILSAMGRALARAAA